MKTYTTPRGIQKSMRLDVFSPPQSLLHLSQRYAMAKSPTAGTGKAWYTRVHQSLRVEPVFLLSNMPLLPFLAFYTGFHRDKLAVLSIHLRTGNRYRSLQ